MLWPGQRLSLTLNSERAKHNVKFEPPWRLTSPVPPAESEQPARLTVTAEPLPGDHAFSMPFGNGMGSVREAHYHARLPARLHGVRRADAGRDARGVGNHVPRDGHGGWEQFRLRHRA